MDAEPLIDIPIGKKVKSPPPGLADRIRKRGDCLVLQLTATESERLRKYFGGPLPLCNDLYDLKRIERALRQSGLEG
jgi:hypothetical protein